MNVQAFLYQKAGKITLATLQEKVIKTLSLAESERGSKDQLVAACKEVAEKEKYDLFCYQFVD